jgi:hypothetical protein
VNQAGFQAFESDVSLEDGKDGSLEITLRLAETRESVVISGGRRQTIDGVYRALRESGIEDVYAVEKLVRRGAGRRLVSLPLHERMAEALGQQRRGQSRR